MKAIMGAPYLFIILAILLGAMLVFTHTTDVKGIDDADLPTMIHALLVVMDADPEAPNRYEPDYNRMNGLLNDIDTTTSCMLNLRALRASSDKRSDYPTRDRILNWIENVNPEPNDVVLVYFAGHGSRDDTSGLEDDGTYLQVKGGVLRRTDLEYALEESDAGNCRLRVLITDSCSGNGRGETKTSISTLEYGHGKAFGDLFIRHQGFLHLASASPGEVAFGDNVDGGWFTSGFVAAIYKDRPTNTQFVGWKQIFEETHENVQVRIDKMSPSHRSMTLRKGVRIKQTPKDYSLPIRVTDPERWVTGRGRTDNMVLIPAGNFRMGAEGLSQQEGIQDMTSHPVHNVYLDAFYIDTHEVTVGEYKEFLLNSNTNLPLPHEVNTLSLSDAHPIVGVSWHAAMAYAKWKGKRLPTEAEWEKAARGGLMEKDYPWGSQEPNSSLANLRRSPITRVGNFPPNRFGLYDMGGNVAEWCLDPWDEDFYANSPRKNPFAGPMSLSETLINYESVQGLRVVRGGAVAVIGKLGMNPFVGMRHKADSTEKLTNIGFRCAMYAR